MSLRVFFVIRVALWIWFLSIGAVAAWGAYFRDGAWIWHTLQLPVGSPVIPSLVIAAACLGLAPIRQCRAIAGVGLYASASLLALALWCLMLVGLSGAWGTTGVTIGLFAGVVGVIPLGLLCQAMHASLGSTMLMIAITCGIFMLRFCGTMLMAMALVDQQPSTGRRPPSPRG